MSAAAYRAGDAVWTNYAWQEGYFESYAPQLPFEFYSSATPSSTITGTLESLFAGHPRLWVVNYRVDVHNVDDYPLNAWLHSHALLAYENWYGNSHLALFARAPELPSGPYDFPRYRITANDPARREPGWLLLSVHRYPTGRYQDWTPARREFTYRWGMIVALDGDGEVVWYYESDAFIEGIDRLGNGNLLFHRWDFCWHEIDLLGNTVSR